MNAKTINRRLIFVRAALLAVLLFAAPLFTGSGLLRAQTAETGKKNTVIVLGMIHSGHIESARYGLDVVRDVITAIDPDYVLTEIPPDRLADAAAGFALNGAVTEDRVRVFPEYRDVLFPLTKELDFRIIPTAGWTRPMADYRRDALNRVSEDPARADDWAAYRAALDAMDAAIGDRADDPLFIHSDDYDAITKKGLQPYARLFADDLGRGDWERINAAHYALIEAALDMHAWEGATILITFGAGHKYWFLEQLRQRDDIDLINPARYFDGANSE